MTRGSMIVYREAAGLAGSTEVAVSFGIHSCVRLSAWGRDRGAVVTLINQQRRPVAAKGETVI